MRALRVLMEDLVQGNGASRDLTLQQTVPAAGRPLIATVGFKASIAATMLPAQTIAANGIIRMVVSKSPGYWMTLTGTVNAVAVTIVVPPLATVFLPVGFAGTTMAANATSAPAGVPLANSDTRLTFDIMQES